MDRSGGVIFSVKEGNDINSVMKRRGVMIYTGFSHSHVRSKVTMKLLFDLTAHEFGNVVAYILYHMLLNKKEVTFSLLALIFNSLCDSSILHLFSQSDSLLRQVEMCDTIPRFLL